MMFGGQWEKAEATIVASLPKYTGDGSTATYEFVADVRPAGGAEPFRATLKEPTIAIDFWPPSIGDVVSVLVKTNGKVKFDKADPRISAKAFEARRKQAFEAAQHQPYQADPDFGSPESAAGDFQGLQSLQSFQGVQVFGAADPSQLRAAADQLRAAGLGALADQMTHQLADQTADQAPDRTATGTAEPDRPEPGSGDDPATRLARLENLRDRGLLSDEEYAAQRQRILNDL
jgi:hypothetical protein